MCCAVLQCLELGVPKFVYTFVADVSWESTSEFIMDALAKLGVKHEAMRGNALRSNQINALENGPTDPVPGELWSV